MIRSTQAQKAERLRAAQRLLANNISMAEAALALSRENGLSLRQAYRYLEAARKKEPPLSAPRPSVTISLKMPPISLKDFRRTPALPISQRAR
jgi:hypothetical protein